jgi:hypothetical protein
MPVARRPRIRSAPDRQRGSAPGGIRTRAGPVRAGGGRDLPDESGRAHQQRSHRGRRFTSSRSPPTSVRVRLLELRFEHGCAFQAVPHGVRLGYSKSKMRMVGVESRGTSRRAVPDEGIVDEQRSAGRWHALEQILGSCHGRVELILESRSSPRGRWNRLNGTVGPVSPAILAGVLRPPARC